MTYQITNETLIRILLITVTLLTGYVGYLQYKISGLNTKLEILGGCMMQMLDGLKQLREGTHSLANIVGDMLADQSKSEKGMNEHESFKNFDDKWLDDEE